MKLTGKNLIAGQWEANQQQAFFRAYQPATNDYGTIDFHQASFEQLNDAIFQAQQSFTKYRRTSVETRAVFLQSIADSIIDLGDDLLDTTHLETGYPIERLKGERQRTVNQLNAFANKLLHTTSNDIYDAEDTSREPLPKPSLLLTQIPLGPVAVFGASNFPYAFSTLGGDTVSALAAGCPVIVKAHPAHPGTSELMGQAIERAIRNIGLPSGIFSQCHSTDPEFSHRLVSHPGIKAVGFTGSQKVADLLFDTISRRKEPIPFYGELGSINPQLVLEQKSHKNPQELATLFCNSLMMSNGQFCTSPGVWIVPEDAKEFVHACTENISEQLSTTLLTKGIQQEYQSSINALKLNKQLQNIANGKTQKSFHGTPSLFITKAIDFVNNEQLRKEIFGPCAVIVTYNDAQQLPLIVEALDGQLTASVHGTLDDIVNHKSSIELLTFKVGRLIYNQMPTGVEISSAMNHGGPYPASTDIRSTSVGLEAINRFLRPLSIQNAPI